MNIHPIPLLCALSGTLAPTLAYAGNEILPPAETAGSVLNAEEVLPTVRFVVPGEGDVTVQFGGRVLYDVSFNSADDDLKSSGDKYFDSAEFRSARFMVKGTIYDAVDYKVNYDFAGGTVGFKDLWMQTQVGCGKIRVGHFFEPFGLEDNTSGKYLTFAERSLTSAFAPSRNGGIMYHNQIEGDTDWTWAIAATRDANSAGDYDGETSGAYNFTARATAAPTNDKETGDLLHLGLSASIRSDFDGDVRFRSRPENHVVPRIVDTMAFPADGYTLAGAEFVYGQGPFSFQSEYMMAKVDEASGGGMNPTFSGYYGGFSYFLTGEHRNYKNGSFGGIKPKSNYGQGGKGAVELTARYSMLDLNDGGVMGGEVTDITFGSNWYLNPNTRIVANYIVSELDDSAATTNGEGSLNSLILRFQFSF